MKNKIIVICILAIAGIFAFIFYNSARVYTFEEIAEINKEDITSIIIYRDSEVRQEIKNLDVPLKISEMLSTFSKMELQRSKQTSFLVKDYYLIDLSQKSAITHTLRLYNDFIEIDIKKGKENYVRYFKILNANDLKIETLISEI